MQRRIRCSVRENKGRDWHKGETPSTPSTSRLPNFGGARLPDLPRSVNREVSVLKSMVDGAERLPSRGAACAAFVEGTKVRRIGAGRSSNRLILLQEMFRVVRHGGKWWSWTQCRLPPSVTGSMHSRSSVTLRTQAH